MTKAQRIATKLLLYFILPLLIVIIVVGAYALYIVQSGGLETGLTDRNLVIEIIAAVWGEKSGTLALGTILTCGILAFLQPEHRTPLLVYAAIFVILALAVLIALPMVVGSHSSP